jgi:hypothetical protein
MLIQPNIDGKRSKWVAKILEFDLDIKRTKLIKDQGLARLVDESNCRELGVNLLSTPSKNQLTETVYDHSHVILNLEECAWYKDIIYFLHNLKPPDGPDKNKVRDLKIKEIKFCIFD